MNVKSLGEVLTDLMVNQRLPISIKLLRHQMGASTEESLKKDLKEMGCEINLVGPLEFLTYVPGRCLEFKPPFASNDQLRDTTVDLLSYRPVNSRPNPVVNFSCSHLTREECGDGACTRLHFTLIVRDGLTDPAAGLCSFLDLCKNDSCKFLHVESESQAVSGERERESADLCWITCDLRSFPISFVFQGLVGAVLLDPPWDIHMELSYGTLTDDEMRDLDLSNIHHPGLGGFVFIWATSRSVEVARDCLRIWGYQRVDEIVWLKTNQVGGTVRSGRTGHWLNHNKEHCLVGMKGDVCYANVGRYRQDCDVIVSPVRENSRKPDELYSIIERLVNGRLCLELFGRRHNRRPGWITMGNQLEGTHVTPHPEIAHRLSQLEI